MYTKHVVCRISGLEFTLTDSYPNSRIFECVEHPTVADRKEFHSLLYSKWDRVPKDYLAAGILLWLQDHELLAHMATYPKHTMGIVNKTLSKLPASVLYEVYHRLGAYTKAWNQEPIALNLSHFADDANPWHIISAIRSTLGDDPNYEPELDYGLRRASLKTRKQLRSKLGKKSKIKSQTKANFNLKAIWKRVPRLATQFASKNKTRAKEIENAWGITIREANYILPCYQNTHEKVRIAMAGLYTDILKEMDVRPGTTAYRSFSKVIELLKAFDLKPLELSEELDIDTLDDILSGDFIF